MASCTLGSRCTDRFRNRSLRLVDGERISAARTSGRVMFFASTSSFTARMSGWKDVYRSGCQSSSAKKASNSAGHDAKLTKAVHWLVAALFCAGLMSSNSYCRPSSGCGQDPAQSSPGPDPHLQLGRHQRSRGARPQNRVVQLCFATPAEPAISVRA